MKFISRIFYPYCYRPSPFKGLMFFRISLKSFFVCLYIIIDLSLDDAFWLIGIFTLFQSRPSSPSTMWSWGILAPQSFQFNHLVPLGRPRYPLVSIGRPIVLRSPWVGHPKWHDRRSWDPSNWQVVTIRARSLPYMYSLIYAEYEKHPDDWRLISQAIKTRTIEQVRSHAQKYFGRL